MQLWIPVVNYEGLYEVSNDGQVRRAESARTKVHTRRTDLTIRQTTTRDGYKRVVLCREGRPRLFPVHHVVLEAFIGPRPEGLVCRHLNGKRDDNRPANLAWGTAAENYADREMHGNNRRGETSPRARLTTALVLEGRRRYAAGETAPAIAKALGVSRNALQLAIIGRSWAHLPGAVPAGSPRGVTPS